VFDDEETAGSEESEHVSEEYGMERLRKEMQKASGYYDIGDSVAEWQVRY
jgi:hypothetical protein